MEQPSRIRHSVAAVVAIVALAMLAGCASDAEDRSSEPVVIEDPPAPSVELAYVEDGCGSWPSHNAGPYFLDHDDLVRTDLTEDQDGVALSVRLTLVGGEDCGPLSGLEVDVWSANAEGLTSGVDNVVFTLNGPDLEGETWLRGRQVSDSDGVVEFATIFPGTNPSGPPHLMVAVAIDDEQWFTTRVVLDPDVAAVVFESASYETAAVIDDRMTFDPLSSVSPVADGDGWMLDLTLALDPLEFRPPPAISNVVSTLDPGESDALPDAEIIGARPFQEMPGEVQAMFSSAASELGVDAVELFDAFATVTSESPPDLGEIAASFGVTVDELGAALPILAGGAPTS